jgi:2-hydroxychromene-2-carboxylate isomerase
MRKLEFFYFFGSAYAFLSVLRIRGLADAAGVEVRWRPFNVRPLMQENNVALRSETRKVKYMWRDVERRAAAHGLPFTKPPIWPTDPELLHNKVGALAAEEGWAEPFTTESFRAWFMDGQALGSEACLETILAKLGKDVRQVLADARSERVAERFEASTEDARRHGVFGSPSFVAGDGEMFWGDDRLEEAIAWAAGTHPLMARA